MPVFVKLILVLLELTTTTSFVIAFQIGLSLVDEIHTGITGAILAFPFIEAVESVSIGTRFLTLAARINTTEPADTTSTGIPLQADVNIASQFVEFMSTLITA